MRILQLNTGLIVFREGSVIVYIVVHLRTEVLHDMMKTDNVAITPSVTMSYIVLLIIDVPASSAFHNSQVCDIKGRINLLITNNSY